LRIAVNVIRLLLDHLKKGPVTLRLPEHVPTGPGYRGLVTMEGSGCLGCGVCAYVCAPGAIEIRRKPLSYDWAYEPGKCTFCARCVLDCPVHVLAMTPASPPPYGRPRELYTVVTLLYPACAQCGQPAMPANDILFNRAFGPDADAIRKWSGLCADCRRKARATELLEAWNGAPSEHSLEPHI
jgi:hydrogenase-4 component H